MSDLFDYILWRGDLSQAAVPFNDVDALIFARLSYVPFEGVVPPGFDGGKPLPEAARQVLAKGALNLETERGQESKRLLELLAEAPRYAGLALCGYESILDREAQEQFAALTIRLPLGCCVCYRGTDGTLVGWKEDFNMSFADVVPAQLHAVEYLGRAAQLPGTIRLCGHSKGGNLAVFAAAFCGESIQSRIVAVRNFDGPGFQRQVAAQPDFQRILGRTRTFLPRASLVGMLLEHEEPYTVVESQGAGGIAQHNVCLWEVTRDGFHELQQVSDGSQFIDRAMKDWVANMDADQREKVVNGIYDALTTTQADTVREVKEKGKMAALRSIMSLDEETRRQTLSAMRMLYHSLRRAMPESPLKVLEERLGLQTEKEDGEG
ncbi:MAG: DUF2974 domain-containing protein [Clostridia bacterium]|nr:DUF2974 domain-containing protein [Clostridia bacterium]